MKDRKRQLREVIPGLKERQLEYLAESHDRSDTIDQKSKPSRNLLLLFSSRTLDLGFLIFHDNVSPLL